MKGYKQNVYNKEIKRTQTKENIKEYPRIF